MNESYRVNDAFGRITQGIVLVYQAIAVLIFGASLILGLDWQNDPFIGGLFEQTMVLNGTDTRQAGERWTLGCGTVNLLKHRGFHSAKQSEMPATFDRSELE